MTLDVTVYAGENQPVTFVLPETDAAGTTFDPEGKTYELVVQYGAQRWVYTESAGLVRTGREIVWRHSLADSRAFPLGRLADVHLQWSEGSGVAQIQMGDRGMLTVVAGVSND
jgi:hypothetical protein